MIGDRSEKGLKQRGREEGEYSGEVMTEWGNVQRADSP